jgi:hypothetical protein
LVVALASGIAVSAAKAQDPLPSWNEGDAKAAIIGFVAAVTEKSNTAYVPPAERIATFDNDGTLWVEAPLYTQIMFAFDRVKAMAPDHPEWQGNPLEDLTALTNRDNLRIIMKDGKIYKNTL